MLDVTRAPAETLTLLLAGDVMTGRGIDQLLAHPGSPAIDEAGVGDAREYLRMAERRSGALRALGADPGSPVAAGRATPGGELRWRITLRDDGVPQACGALPSLIQWDGPHPTTAMDAGGVALESLAVGPLPRDVRACLAVPGLGDAPLAGLRATLLTARGRIVLDSAGAGTGRGAQP
jgi:hypothetical protein